jgi:lipopolysaccharide transport system ATP-binding protein
MSCEESGMPGRPTTKNAPKEHYTAESIIKVTNLGKRYCIYEKPLDRIKQGLWRQRRKYCKEFWALRKVSFEIRRGETIGVIGRNGSGKSTLLQLICRTLEPSEGLVHAEGRVAALLELGSGFNPEFSGLENVYMNATLLGLKQTDIDNQLENILSFADIGDFIHQPVKSYSSGMQVRLAFAVLAHVGADILICDEALAVGDAVFTQRCMRFIKTFQESGTLLFVSHDLGSVAALTDRCLWINKGSLVFDGMTRIGLQEYSSFCQEESGFRAKTSNASKQHQEIATKAKESMEMRSPSYNKQKMAENLQAVAQENRVSTLAHSWENSMNKIAEEIITRQRDTEGLGHCDGVAIIIGWTIIDESAGETMSPAGGSLVDIIVKCRAVSELHSPLVGFQVVDRRGQVLFGDNTFGDSVDEKKTIGSNVDFYAAFRIQWPFLAPGEYTINLAVSTGTFTHHVNHHWIHEAIIITSMESPRKVTGLFAPPIDHKDLRQL